MYSRRDQPCATCPAAEYCWNYTKVPDDGKPGGAWLIRGWFDCNREDAPRAMVLGDIYPMHFPDSAGWYARIHLWRP